MDCDITSVLLSVNTTSPGNAAFIHTSYLETQPPDNRTSRVSEIFMRSSNISIHIARQNGIN